MIKLLVFLVAVLAYIDTALRDCLLVVASYLLFWNLVYEWKLLGNPVNDAFVHLIAKLRLRKASAKTIRKLTKARREARRRIHEDSKHQVEVDAYAHQNAFFVLYWPRAVAVSLCIGAIALLPELSTLYSCLEPG